MTSRHIAVASIAATLLWLSAPAGALSLSPSQVQPRSFAEGPVRPAIAGMFSLAQSSDEPPDDDPDDDTDDIDDDAADPGAADPGGDDPGADDDMGGDDVGGDDVGGDDVGGDDAGTGADDDGPGGDDTGTGADDDGPGGDDGGAGGDDDGPGGDDDGDDDGGNSDDDDGTGASQGGSRASGNSVSSGGFGLGGGRGRALNESAGGSTRARDLYALGPEEIYDAAGYVARRGQLLALNPSERALAEARSLGYSVAERFRLASAGIDVVRFRLPDSEQVSDALASLRAADPTAVFDYEHLYDFSPSGTEDIERPKAMSMQSRSSLSSRDDLRIGLIDSAIDPTTPAINAARIQQRVFVSTGEPPTREHGTAVASILASRDNGLLPRSQYFIASVFHQSPRGESIGVAADLARAIDWLMAQKTPVINMSLAGPPNSILEAAVRRAQDRGHIVVAAVGNAGPAARPQYPAAYAGVVGVTAIDDNGRVYRRAVRGQHVDFAAPGVAVAAASPAGPDSAVSGTSFAAPYVAAALALRHTALDPLSAQRAVADLARESADLGDPGQDPVYGFGAVPLRAMTR
jgi:hypothetical protein